MQKNPSNITVLTNNDMSVMNVWCTPMAHDIHFNYYSHQILDILCGSLILIYQVAKYVMCFQNFRNREKHRKQAKELLRQGKTREAHEHFQRCVEVTSEMAFEVINACRERNVDVIGD